MSRPVRIGCSGWQYKDWRERFYPKGCAQRKWLRFYSRTFGTVEVNPASDLLVLDGGALVPLRFVVSTDDGVVTVDPPDGLFDL